MTSPKKNETKYKRNLKQKRKKGNVKTAALHFLDKLFVIIVSVLTHRTHFSDEINFQVFFLEKQGYVATLIFVTFAFKGSFVDCPTFITSDIHHPLTEFRLSSPPT